MDKRGCLHALSMTRLRLVMKGKLITARSKTKARGQRGSWFAEVNGESLPCVHAYWFKNGWYDDPHARPGEQQWEELFAAIREKKRVVLTTYRVIDGGIGFERAGYVAVYAVDNISVDGSRLRFQFTESLIELE